MVSKADRERLFGKKGEAPRKDAEAKAPAAPRKPPERITYRCGHSDSNPACPACRRQRWLEGMRKRGEKVAEKITGERGFGRLPDGSNFRVVYDAAKEQWTGTLTILLPPGPIPETLVFQGEASSVFGLLVILDRQYRQWLANQSAK